MNNLLGATIIKIGDGEVTVKTILGDVEILKVADFTANDIPKLAKILDNLKSEKAKTIVPKYKEGDVVHRYGYSDCYGEIKEIDISIEDDGEPTITYTIWNVGMAWESELELHWRK